MIAFALVTIVLSIIGVDIANGQGMRGFAGGSRGFGIAVQPGRAVTQTTSGRTIVSSPSTHLGGATQWRAPAAPFAPSTGAFLPPGGVKVYPGAPVFVPPVAPYHQFRPLPIYRHPGILIIDVPAFYDTTVVTQTVPSVTVDDRRPVENPPAELRSRTPGQWAPFDPTPQEVVDQMLSLTRVRSGDLVYDLGAGDGRMVISAAKKYGVRAIGFEIDPGLVKLARENARKQGVEHLVEIRQQDFLTADLSPATVVTLYLSHDGNLALRSRLMNQLKPGARIVSYTFDMGDWRSKITQSYRDAAGNIHMMYLWEIGGALMFSDGRS